MLHGVGRTHSLPLMAKYIFLDTWVFDLLRNPRIEAGLVELIKSEGLTVLITSLSMVELYNPGWQGAGDNERGAVAAASWLAYRASSPTLHRFGRGRLLLSLPPSGSFHRLLT